MDLIQPPLELVGRRFTDSFDGTGGPGGIELEYQLGADPFIERFTFDFPATGGHQPDDPAVQRLLDVLLVCAGVSYYKLTVPGRIRSRVPLHPETAALVPHLYDHGLRELAVRNGLDVPLAVDLTAEDAPAHDVVTTPPTARRALIPFGGGKDSTFTLTLLDDPTALAVHPTPVQRRVSRAAGVDLLGVKRTLDPLLAVRTAEGGMNGHIPITAINSAVSALVAALCGFDEVVMANERSAEEPTQFAYGNVPVNHQYSKTFAFEQVLADALRPAGITYFSMVRSWSELAIAGALAPAEALRNEILSCNRAFSLTHPHADPTWCLDCAKCRFTFLSFAVFLTPEAAVAMFGGNPLDEARQIEGFRALWADKPFDCVGELAESALALAAVAARPEWADFAVVAALSDDARRVGGESGTSLEALLTPTGPDAVPERYRPRLDAARPTPIVAD